MKALKLNRNHPDIGKVITAPHGTAKTETKGIVVAVREGITIGSRVEGHKLTVKTYNVVKYQVQPDNGSKKFWTGVVITNGETK